MKMNRRSWLVLFGLLLVLVTANLHVFRLERTLGAGVAVLLELVPADPRSLMQGDYMQLQFALARDIERLRNEGRVQRNDRYAVLKPDAQGVGQLQRVQSGLQPVDDDEIVLRFDVTGNRVRLTSDAYFFEEGAADRFSQARYALVRVGPDGRALLESLRDVDRRAL